LKLIAKTTVSRNFAANSPIFGVLALQNFRNFRSAISLETKHGATKVDNYHEMLWKE